MKKLNVAVVLLFLLSFTTNQVNAQKLSLEEKNAYYIKLLANLGLKGQLDSDGDVQFSYNDHKYFLGSSSTESKFVRITLFEFWEVEDAEELMAAYRACNIVTKDSYVVKAYVLKGYVWFSCELLYDDTKNLSSSLVAEAIDFIEKAVEKFVGEM